MKRSLINAVVILSVLAAGGAGYWFFYAPYLAAQESKAPAAQTAAKPAGGPPGVPVETAQVETRTLYHTITAVGTIIANESVILRPEIAGRIVRINFDEGTPVEKGRSLFELDSSTYKAEISQVKANLDLSQKNLDRALELLQKGAGTPRTRDEAVATHKVNEATLRYKETMLAKTVIHAPFDGIVGLRQVSIGDYVSPGQDLVNLVNIDPIKVDFQVPETALTALSVGSTVAVSVDAFADQTFEGTVYAIDPRLDTGTRSIIVRARIANPEGKLRPGLFARVNLTLGTRPNALLIPEQAVIPVAEDRFVFRVVDGKVFRTQITLGMRQNAKVEVTDGLAAGEVVVTAGHQKLRDGAPVMVLPSAGGA